MDKLIFAWWNTSLSPASKSRATKADLAHACRMIDHLVIQTHADFIALGEMSTSDIEYLKRNCTFTGYNYVNGTSSTLNRRSKFDLCYIYNISKMDLISKNDVITTKGNRSFKVAQKLELKIASYHQSFYLFVSHWPSRIWHPELSAVRDFIGVRLRDQIDHVIEQSNSDPFIILMGDYNDEPFSKPIADHLMATRDEMMVFNQKHLLYNPFWNWMGYGDKLQVKHDAGSYFYHSGDTTKWHTFDQIILSHAFINAKDWRLAEPFDFIVNVPWYRSRILARKSKFDHIPVACLIQKVI